MNTFENKKFLKKDAEMKVKRLEVPFEVKEVSEDDDFYYFKGYGSTFGNVDRGGDVVVQGAFKQTLMKQAPVLLWQHDRGEPLGVFAEIHEDSKGLYLEGKMPKNDTFVSGRVYPQLKTGSIKSMSIGYSVDQYEIVDGITYLKELTLWEVSLVTFPMNPLATVDSVKSIDEIKTERDAERYLGEFLSSNKSKHFISKMKELFSHREVGKKQDSREDYSKIITMLTEIKEKV